VRHDDDDDDDDEGVPWNCAAAVGLSGRTDLLKQYGLIIIMWTK